MQQGEYDGAKSVRESTVFENLITQFEAANKEQQYNCDRLMTLRNKLNSEPPSPELPKSLEQKKGITSGEGMLAAIEGMIKEYQKTINIQQTVISQLEKLI